MAAAIGALRVTAESAKRLVYFDYLKRLELRFCPWQQRQMAARSVIPPWLRQKREEAGRVGRGGTKTHRRLHPPATTWSDIALC